MKRQQNGIELMTRLLMARGAPKDSAIVKVHAVDQDVGNNGELFYQLVHGKGDLFRVGRKSGLVTLRNPLEDHKDEYMLTVAAYDGGTPPFRYGGCKLFLSLKSCMTLMDMRFKRNTWF